MYVLLSNEDYALLLGSIGLFIIMVAVMFLTRKVDWYGIELLQESVFDDDAESSGTWDQPEHHGGVACDKRKCLNCSRTRQQG
jgi:hypothetical protein